MSTPNNRTSKCIKQKLIELKNQIDKSTIITGAFYTSLLVTKENIKQNISKDLEDLNNSIIHNIIGLYRIPQPTTAEYTSFSNSHFTFIKTDHILGQKIRLTKFFNQKK